MLDRQLLCSDESRTRPPLPPVAAPKDPPHPLPPAMGPRICHTYECSTWTLPANPSDVDSPERSQKDRTLKLRSWIGWVSSRERDTGRCSGGHPTPPCHGLDLPRRFLAGPDTDVLAYTPSVVKLQRPRLRVPSVPSFKGSETQGHFRRRPLAVVRFCPGRPAGAPPMSVSWW